MSFCTECCMPGFYLLEWHRSALPGHTSFQFVIGCFEAPSTTTTLFLSEMQMKNALCSSACACVYFKSVWVTSTILLSFQSYACCICDTSSIQRMLKFVKLECSWRNPTRQHFWWGLVFLWFYTSDPEGEASQIHLVKKETKTEAPQWNLKETF